MEKFSFGESGDKKERLKNIAELKTPNAKYEIVYSHHKVQNNSEIVKNVDAILLERAGELDTEEKVRAEILYQNTQERKIIIESAKAGKPIFFVDLIKMKNDEGDEMEVEQSLKDFILSLEGFLGFSLIYSGAKALSEKRKISRRDFLKSGAKFLVGGYLNMPIAKGIMTIARSLSGEPDEASLIRKMDKKLTRTENLIHPELKTRLVEGRNDLMAQKSEFVAQVMKEELKRSPNLALVIGAGHSGIEQSLLKEKEERVANISKDFKNTALIARVDFEPSSERTGGIEISVSFIEDPDLKATEKK